MDLFSPPQAQLKDPQIAAMPRPRQVVAAVALLWISFGLTFPLAYLSITDEAWSYPWFIGLFALFMAFSAVANVFVYRGHNWARFVCLGIVVLGILGALTPSPDDTTLTELEAILTGTDVVTELGVIFLLLSKPSARWFRHRELE